MLGPLIMWRALVRDTYGVTMLGALLLVVVLGVILWNLIP